MQLARVRRPGLVSSEPTSLLPEKRWNDAMQRMADLEAELATFERQEMRSVTEEQKQQILQLGRDFPRLWKAKTTSTCDRKRILRLLIRDVTVVKDPEPRLLRLQICWQGGATEVLEVRTGNQAIAGVNLLIATFCQLRLTSGTLDTP